MWKLNGKKNKSAMNTLEAETLSAYAPAFKLIRPERPQTPLILASPHSGRLYPESFIQQTQLKLAKLRLGEDCYIDTIFKPLTQHGIPLLHALFPRCYVDLNRHAKEWPPENLRKQRQSFETSQRARTGLGVVPTRIAHNLDIYPQNLRSKHIQARLNTLYHPYHSTLENLINSTKEQCGRAVLLDCHSMPGTFVSGIKRADFILGDRYGQSCNAGTMDKLHEKLQSQGYTVTRNIPYAGGYITRHYGKPNMGVETIQIEINKDLYLDPHTLKPHAGIKPLIKNMEDMVLHMVTALEAAPSLAAQ